ncbi:hypothetical protein lerEdw1_014398 [Lerista edwardsae]|nr:hypothetical protein lerEdw1_014398 [Lerista edwardsae]
MRGPAAARSVLSLRTRTPRLGRRDGKAVSSLLCWWCDRVESNWGCWRLQSCSSEENYCVTTYVGAGIGGYSSQSISKGCAPVCPSTGINIGIAAASVKCCTSSFCNISGATGVRANHLLLAAGVLASLFCLFGAKLR